MKAQHVRPMAVWGMFLTPVLLGTGTCIPVYMAWQGFPTEQKFETIATAIPFVLTLIALAITLATNRRLAGYRLLWLTLFSSGLSAAAMMWLRHSDTASLMMRDPLTIFLAVCVTMFIGPLLFLTGIGFLWAHERSTRAPVNACSGCGYDLTGLEDKTICPECGAAKTETK